MGLLEFVKRLNRKVEEQKGVNYSHLIETVVNQSDKGTATFLCRLCKRLSDKHLLTLSKYIRDEKKRRDRVFS
jgi:hypothetical protein